MDKVISILGPTAVGKTNLSIDLAKRLNTDIISGDSMLVYRGMDIGTAKPSILERAGITHHLVDILEPYEDFSVTKFTALASNSISKLNCDNKIPILAGGTGLYVKALLEGYKFNITPANDSFRNNLEKLSKEFGNDHLHSLLKKVDPITAERLHPNDTRRIIRALEVYHVGGENISQEKTADDEKFIYDAIVIGLNMDRKLLYERINNRVDIMVNNGLIEEVQNLLDSGVPASCQAMKGIGYKEIVSYINGEVNLTTAIDNIKKATRHFAKRQLTWYRRMEYIEWFDVSNVDQYEDTLEIIYRKIAGKFCLE
ncbi:tRNA (adenosine(37)-N6)-dimethylallyltransferase MiaA [Dendrosporobacter sp. 1207_IL3150]|uniref:tRNA (adenosine(37)-N6)-dimethylallyltransferase MiaA n=1 Tax=Dendrosporobacter sp. 1207_IL3150 TaxID=3084054 RepID=UPI002FDB1B57